MGGYFRKVEKLQDTCLKFLCSKSKLYEAKHHTKVYLRESPNHFILYTNKNDLNSDWSLRPMAKSVVNIAALLKNINQDVTISNTAIIEWKTRQPKVVNI